MNDTPQLGAYRIRRAHDKGFDVDQFSSQGWIWMAWYAEMERAQKFCRDNTGRSEKREREALAVFEPR